jgi:predicted CXXCH cytochrome family protein
MCHGSHKSVSPKLLLDSGDQLCLNCHNGQDIYATTYHSDALTSACVSCHNPHGSDQEHLLTSKTP